MVQLIKLIGNEKIMKILSFFFRNPTNEFSQSELLKKLKISKATLIKWLKLLINEEFIFVKKIGPTNLYRLNNEKSIVKHLKVLFTISELEPLKKIALDHNVELYIYGSSARGENVETSDIDLLAIGNADKSIMLKDISSFSERIKKEIKTQVFSKQEWAMIARKDPPFYERLEKDKVRI